MEASLDSTEDGTPGRRHLSRLTPPPPPPPSPATGSVLPLSICTRAPEVWPPSICTPVGLDLRGSELPRYAWISDELRCHPPLAAVGSRNTRPCNSPFPISLRPGPPPPRRRRLGVGGDADVAQQKQFISPSWSAG
ncbi:hypothetical protein BRADI_3g30844v3 [Brachypodium distachyon]|uniref:Uncharacterized protein n=1 Tax=Brachypodium distachyon TaxID=15368 RepID=A0A2K2D0B6_BRADI|nr:hypothetical protein BRADI_3g30844v3 [Brachypodium distachyon]